jgi:hypothetical protein
VQNLVVERLRLGVVVERMLCAVVKRMMRLCEVERGAWFAAEVEVEHIEVEHSEDGGGLE